MTRPKSKTEGEEEAERRKTDLFWREAGDIIIRFLISHNMSRPVREYCIVSYSPNR